MPSACSQNLSAERSQNNFMSKPKILFHNTKLEEGGGERITRSVALGLARRGADVSLAVLNDDGPSRADWPTDLVPLTVLHAKNTLKSVGPLAQFFRHTHPDIVVTALHQPSSAAILARMRSSWKPKIVVTLHSAMEREARDSGSRNRQIMPHVVRRLYPKADGIIAVSKAGMESGCRVLNRLPEGADISGPMPRIPKDRFRVIYNPVVTDDFFERAKEKPDLDVFHEFEGPVLLGLGRLDPLKDFPTVFRALQIVRRSMDFRYVLFGEGPEREKLEGLRKELGLEKEILMPGYRKNPVPFLKAARLLFMTSQLEGLPTVIIESLAAGTPVVFTDCPTGPVEILQPPKYGLCPPMSNPEAAAEAVLQELSRPKTAPPPESWAPYTEEASLSEYISYLSEIAGRSIIG